MVEAEGDGTGSRAEEVGGETYSRAVEAEGDGTGSPVEEVAVLPGLAR